MQLDRLDWLAQNLLELSKLDAQLGKSINVLVKLRTALQAPDALTGPVVITYLTSLRLTREQFVGTVSVIYLFGMAPLYLALAWAGRLGVDAHVEGRESTVATVRAGVLPSLTPRGGSGVTISGNPIVSRGRPVPVSRKSGCGSRSSL